MVTEITLFNSYAERLTKSLSASDWPSISLLAQEMKKRWENGNQVFFCGNGGSAANAIHLVNDFLYGIAKSTGNGLKVKALTANSAVITCLANDVGYESVFSEQLAVLGERDDLLVVLSGSGNSPNIIKVLKQAKSMQIGTCAILGFDGGDCKRLADIVIHFPIDDMQISEDMQLIIGHMIMQWLSFNSPLKED